MAKKEGKGPSRNGTSGALDRLKSLYQFMTDNGLETLELEEEGRKVRLVRRSAQATPFPEIIAASPAAGSGLPPPGESGLAAPGVAGAAVPAPLSIGTGLKAPMMGIFYRSPTPSSPPFVKEGDLVKQGQVLCMIEAMKVFNEIKADFAGTIIKVCVENGKPVKSGQDLFAIHRT